MKPEPAIFEERDPDAEAAADARAEADVKAGRLISHGAVKKWLAAWGSGKPHTRPRAGE